MIKPINSSRTLNNALKSKGIAALVSKGIAALVLKFCLLGNKILKNWRFGNYET
jgi:hypothetical protein